MIRKRRTEILIKGAPDIAGQLAGEILERYQVQTIEEDNSGLVMVKVREKAKRSLFYLGEVLITECKVMIDGRLGIGMVKGFASELAYHLAVIDAAYNADLPETKAWLPILEAEEERVSQEETTFQHRILNTKVNFDTMDV